MRIESSVTAISWIPSEAVEGLPKLPFSFGVAHYDDPPPERLESLDALREADAFREANELRAFIEVDDAGAIVDYGHLGGGYIGVTRVKLGPRELTIPAVAYPTLQPEPQVGPDRVRFEQTAGGRTGAPAPRRVEGKPYFQIASATAWTTLALTIHADGRVEHELVGASTFPRHWLYDADGKLVGKSGVIDFEDWYRTQYGERTPWGDENLPSLVTEVESALERELSRLIMGKRPAPRRLAPGETLVEQGVAGRSAFLLLDGVFAVEVDGETVVEIGPGAIVGERALLEGERTATLRAVTPAKVVEIPEGELSRAEATAIATGHRREQG